MNQLSLLEEKKRSHILFILSFTQLWESFSFYGMRALLVLYLISHLSYQEKDAFAIYALYTSLIEIGALVGGYCADRFLGLRRSVLFGATFICIGHLCLTFFDSIFVFFVGLGAIICGATLFRSNLKALVGLLYEKNEVNSEAGFTFFYTCMNLGGFAAAIFCGYIAQTFGWSFGLGLAALGMLVSMGIFVAYFDLICQLEEKQHALSFTIYYRLIFIVIVACLGCGYALTYFALAQSIVLPLAVLSLIGLFIYLNFQIPLKSILLLSGLLGLLMFYFMIEELMGSLLMVFCEKQVDRLLLGFEIPSTMLAATNPLTIIVVGPLLTYLLKRFSLNLSVRLSLVYLCLALACHILYLAIQDHPTALQVMLSFALIALGELLLVPTMYAVCSQLGSVQHKGVMMATVALAFALASLLSGYLSQAVSEIGEQGLVNLMLSVTIISTFLVFCFMTFYRFSSFSSLDKESYA